MIDHDNNQSAAMVEQREVLIDYGAEYSQLMAGLRVEIGLFRFLHHANDGVSVVEVIEYHRHRFEVVSDAPGKVTLQERNDGEAQMLLEADFQDENAIMLRAFDLETGTLLPVEADAYGVKSVHDLLHEVIVLNQRL